jgi:hypothetical protein
LLPWRFGLQNLEENLRIAIAKLENEFGESEVLEYRAKELFFYVQGGWHSVLPRSQFAIVLELTPICSAASR